MAPRPSSGPLRYQLCSMGQTVAGEHLKGVCFNTRTSSDKGGADTLGVLQQSCYVIMRSNKKVLMTERSGLFFCSDGCQRAAVSAPGFSG